MSSLVPPFGDDPLELLVVMTCYRAAQLTIDCLETLEPEIAANPRTAVMICENGSDDDSLASLNVAITERDWRSWVCVRPVSPNRGFSGGNNVVLREALAWPRPPRAFLLLNTDTLVHPGALRAFLEAGREHPDAGVIGCRLEFPDGRPQTSSYRYRSPMSELIRAAGTGLVTRLLSRWDVHLPPAEVLQHPDWVSFAAAWVRLEMMQQIGLLDEGYYLYFDDLDYCRMARDAGWDVVLSPNPRIVHLHGQSNPVEALTRRQKRRPRYYYASRARYFAKFYGPAGLWAANLLWGVGRMLSWLRERVGGKAPHTCEHEWRDLWINAGDPMRPPEESTMQGRGRALRFG